MSGSRVGPCKRRVSHAYQDRHSPDMTLDEIAALLEKNSIKWVPIIEDGQLGGTSDTKKQAVRQLPN